MTSRAIIGASIAAAVGALLWGGISAATGYEIGYIAWGIGLIVGGVARKFDSTGSTSGVVCALLTLAAIFVGKTMAVQFTMPGQIREFLEAELTPDVYEEMVQDAEDFALLESEEDYPEFMISHAYTIAESSEYVTSEEIDTFDRYTVPELLNLHDYDLSYEEWRKEHIDRVTKGISGELPAAEIAMQSLGFIDIVFALLGVGTAYKLGNGEQ